MKILGIVPARGGSKGIPGKNKKLLRNKPLILYTLEAAIKSRIDKVIVSTDDQEIASIVNSVGIEVMMRPRELAQDDTPTLPVLQHVVESVNDSYDAIMTLQPTSPMRTSSHINESIELFELNPDADSLVSVVRLPHNCNPVSLMQMDGKWLRHLDGFEEKVIRRQDKPLLWARNGAAIYITRTSRIQKYIIGGNILAYEMGKLESIDLDEPDDWHMAEALLMYSGKGEIQ